MKRIVSEQPVQLPKVNKFFGKTVNLYTDSVEDYPDMQVKLKDIKNDSYSVKVTFTKVSDNKEGFMIYDCRIGKLYMGNTSQTLYNKKFTDDLKLNFCSTSRGGMGVGKADYASVDQNPSTMAESKKKVVRLTEDDLVRLVKKVLSEQSSPQGNPVNVIQDCFDKNGANIKDFPTCMKLGTEVMGGKSPNPQTLNGCISEVTNNFTKLKDKIFTIGYCISSKMDTSPVRY